ncbi:hypothetical protein AB0D56_10230 [Streptomyces sp. NPDC048209]|uniref:hypothetical protein n=1 Tax=Streptomyces sp. NPDC048209 TaxID=3156689 RepID=UPI003444F84E
MAANSRNTPARKTTAARPSRSPRELAPAAEPQDAETSAAEAQELEAEGHYVTALLCDEELHIIPPGAWRQSWQRLLNEGQIDAFAETVMPPEDYDRFVEIDPTNDEFGEFIGDAAARAGESLGKSRGPGTSSRSTRRR